MNQAKPPFKASPPQLLASCDSGFSTWLREMCELQAPFSLARFTRKMEGGGRSDLRIDANSITDHRIRLKFNMKMDNGVVLLCNFDKICLILTGNFWRALASLLYQHHKLRSWCC